MITWYGGAAGLSSALVCTWAGGPPLWPYWEDLCYAVPTGQPPTSVLHGKPQHHHTCSTGALYHTDIFGEYWILIGWKVRVGSVRYKPELACGTREHSKRDIKCDEYFSLSLTCCGVELLCLLLTVISALISVIPAASFHTTTLRQVGDPASTEQLWPQITVAPKLMCDRPWRCCFLSDSLSQLRHKHHSPSASCWVESSFYIHKI